MKLKQLQERRGSLVKEARQILDTANAETRALSVDEQTKFANIEGEITSLDTTIDAEIRQMARESRPVTLTQNEERDINRFDLSAVLQSLHRTARGITGSELKGIEAEMIAEGEKEARAAGLQSSGIFLPRVLVRRGVEKRDMTASVLSEGGNTIPTLKRGLLDDFFNASVLRQAGATVLEGLTGNVDIPRLLAGTNPTGKTENANADEVSPTTAMLSLVPKRLPAFIDLSERLLNQSSSAIESIVRSHLTNQMAAIQERAFFHGTGTNEAQGIAGTAGIGSVAGGANGAAPTWANIVNLRKAVGTTNALMGSLGYITNSDIEAKLATTPKVSATDSQMILNDFNGRLASNNLWITNAVREDLTKGTSVNTCSAIFYGNYADYFIGYWGGISLELVRDKANAIGGLYTLVANAYYDGGVARPKSFAAMLDALGD